jgi:hypothetical protein
MKREEMTRIVQLELKHLARGDVGSAQNQLRKLYNARRRHDLTTNKPNRETLRFCIRAIEEKHPGFVPEYDETFFGKVDETPKKGLIQSTRTLGGNCRGEQKILSIGKSAEGRERKK